MRLLRPANVTQTMRCGRRLGPVAHGGLVAASKLAQTRSALRLPYFRNNVLPMLEAHGHSFGPTARRGRGVKARKAAARCYAFRADAAG